MWVLKGVGCGVGMWVVVAAIPLVALNSGTRLPGWVWLASLVLLLVLIAAMVWHFARQRSHPEETIDFLDPFPF
jgi:hypothetical protein